MKKFLVLFALLLSACTTTSLKETPTSLSEEVIGQKIFNHTQSASPAAIAITASPTLEPTLDTRLSPEEWQNWPVIPEISGMTREIYRKGIEMGNDPTAFSKVGDCQNLKEYFLGRYDHLDQYEFDFDIEPYRDTIENFQGHFYRDGQAAKFGFTAASPLSQLQADPEICMPDETPLECEIRVTKPSFIVISLEFPFSGRTPEVYGHYLRKIVEYAISEGVVPILATKADNVEGDHSINHTIAQIAYEYDIPLWNWWLAAQPLWNHGIDTYRDGFHISQQAWWERSKTFLQTLDFLWKGLREG